MSTLTRHLTAMQAAATVTMTVAGLLGSPLLAEQAPDISGLADSAYADHIVSKFAKTGAETMGIYDNRVVENSSFDFAAFMSHTCMNPTEFDLASCKAEFGPYANLKTIYNDGTLFLILKERPIVAAAAQFAPAPANIIVPEPITENVSSSVAATETTMSPEDLVRERSVNLWKACRLKGMNREKVARCYQRNIRRTQEWDTGMDLENIY